MVSQALHDLQSNRSDAGYAEARSGGAWAAAGITHRPPSGCAMFATEAARILDDVRQAMECSPQNARAAALRLVTFLTPPAVAEPVPARGGLAPWQRRKVERYMEENLVQPIRAHDLSGHISLSVSHFCRAFKDSFGDTPHAYIVRRRLELAQKLMLTTDNPLSQIALACGFADQAHFCRLFRREIGASPGAWRRRNLTDVSAETGSDRGPETPLFGKPADHRMPNFMHTGRQINRAGDISARA